MRSEILDGVPVFPLNTVLFPSMPLPLHIFEERYRAMVRDLQGGDNRFCVSLIREGQEVGGGADPFPVGCLAEVVHLDSLPGGRYLLVAVGHERVRFLSLDRVSKPYLTGSAQLWPDEDPAGSPDLVETASRLFEEYVHLMMKIAGQEDEKFAIPKQPSRLSYMIGSGLQIEPDTRQRLLEIPGSAERLESEVGLMRDEMPLLRSLVGNPPRNGRGMGEFSCN